MNTITGRNRSWVWILYALVAVIGLLVGGVGLVEARAHLVFGGVMLLLIAVAATLHEVALRPGPDDSQPSHGEKAAWSQVGMGLSAIMVLGGMSLGSMSGKFASYLFFATYVLLVAAFPFFRRRFVEENRRYREVGEDERDRTLRARGDSLSKRVLELSLVGLAIVWVIAPELVHGLGGPVQIGSFLLLPVLLANVVGEARVARLHWLDRR